jgi:hypothetical protein
VSEKILVGSRARNDLERAWGVRDLRAASIGLRATRHQPEEDTGGRHDSRRESCGASPDATGEGPLARLSTVRRSSARARADESWVAE